MKTCINNAHLFLNPVMQKGQIVSRLLAGWLLCDSRKWFCKRQSQLYILAHSEHFFFSILSSSGISLIICRNSPLLKPFIQVNAHFAAPIKIKVDIIIIIFNFDCSWLTSVWTIMCYCSMSPQVTWCSRAEQTALIQPSFHHPPVPVLLPQV